MTLWNWLLIRYSRVLRLIRNSLLGTMMITKTCGKGLANFEYYFNSIYKSFEWLAIMKNMGLFVNFPIFTISFGSKLLAKIQFIGVLMMWSKPIFLRQKYNNLHTVTKCLLNESIARKMKSRRRETIISCSGIKWIRKKAYWTNI